jgi:RNA polymerase sigma-70 factor (ECF subfamily)
MPIGKFLFDTEVFSGIDILRGRVHSLTQEADDLEIIAQLRLGKTERFAELVRKYQSRVRGYCTSILSDRTAADDAAQDIFIKVFRGIDKFRADSKFSTWLYRISVNHCRDILRANARRRAESWDTLSEAERESVVDSARRVSGVERVEDRQFIEQTLQLLPAEYREIIILRDGHDLSYEQIAQTLDCSLDAVKARIRRARAQLLEISRHFLDHRNVRRSRGGS